MENILERLIPGERISFGELDEHGNPAERSRHSHPYSYSQFVQWRGGKNSEANGSVYSDRLYQWDHAKHDELCEKHFGDRGQYWHDRAPEKIEAFLRDYEDSPSLKLIYIMQGCNVSSGFPVWLFNFHA